MLQNDNFQHHGFQGVLVILFVAKNAAHRVRVALFDTQAYIIVETACRLVGITLFALGFLGLALLTVGSIGSFIGIASSIGSTHSQSIFRSGRLIPHITHCSGIIVGISLLVFRLLERVQVTKYIESTLIVRQGNNQGIAFGLRYCRSVRCSRSEATVQPAFT